MEAKAFLDAVEYELMEGGARWVADFPESIRRVRIADLDFDMVVKGSTRGRSGFFLSALAARFTLPDYSVACLVKVANEGMWDAKGLRTALTAARKFMEENELKWMWLVLGQAGEPSRAVARQVEEINEKEVGVALVNLDTLRGVSSSNLLGRNVFRLMPHGRRKAVSKGREVKEGSRTAIQAWYLIGLFGGFLILAMILSGIALFLMTDVFFIPVPFFIGDVAVAAFIAYLFYIRRFRLEFGFDGYKFHLFRGTDAVVEARWADYDMVSLFHMGGGRYHLTLYARHDHRKYVDIPASTVGLDPTSFRWKAMELTAHGRQEYPTP